jgi:predicted DNA-binding antitoxin AbrB/MazE fold protein
MMLNTFQLLWKSFSVTQCEDMAQILEAVYENGIFRPLQPPDLSEGQIVQLVVSPNPDLKASCFADTARVARIRMFRGILQKPNDERSMVDELIQERREEI